MEWVGCSMLLQPPGILDSTGFDAIEDMPLNQDKEELFGDNWLQCYATSILNAKYKFIYVTDITDNLTHLNAHQKADLLEVLQDNSKMSDWKLGVYPHRKVHIDLVPDAETMHSWYHTQFLVCT